MSTLSKNEILKHIKCDDENTIVVTPILDEEKQIDSIGIDLRLSNQFIVFKSENIASFDSGDFNDKPDLVRGIQKKVVIPFGYSFVLHPQVLVLSATFEYISLPNDIEGSIEGRSSWARNGLIIASATSIDPGYKGCVTLELSNYSNIPLKLYPGLRIAKLIFRETSSNNEYQKDKKYYCSIGPEFSKAHLDHDNKFFINHLKK